MLGTQQATATTDRKKLVRRYFRKTPDAADLRFARSLMVAAATTPVLAFATFLLGSNVLGGAFLVAGIVLAIQGYEKKAGYERQLAAAEPKPSNQEMDRFLAADLQRAAPRSMRLLGLTSEELELTNVQVHPIASLGGLSGRIQPERGPLLVFGPHVPSLAAVGEDGIWRFSIYDVMVICPTGYLLGVYQCTIDLISGEIRDEKTQEYHYADVVAVSTRTSRAEDDMFNPLDLRFGRTVNPFGKAAFRTFEIVVSSGDRSTIVVGIMDEDRPDRQARLQESGIDRVITAVRRMLREKKGGTPPAR